MPSFLSELRRFSLGSDCFEKLVHSLRSLIQTNEMNNNKPVLEEDERWSFVQLHALVVLSCAIALSLKFRLFTRFLLEPLLKRLALMFSFL